MKQAPSKEWRRRFALWPTVMTTGMKHSGWTIMFEYYWERRDMTRGLTYMAKISDSDYHESAARLSEWKERCSNSGLTVE